jgi:D-amino-acid dehydrogenase
MARTDVVVLGAGIVGTSVGLHLVKRGLSAALIDRGRPGEETSYGNAGVIGGAGVFPAAFPTRLTDLLRIAFKRAPQVNYHLAHLPKIASWLMAFRAASAAPRLIENARLMRPLLAFGLPEHEVLMAEAGAQRYLRKNGWISIYRSKGALEALEAELRLGASLGIRVTQLDPEGARALEPSLQPVFRHAMLWPDIASVSNPLAVTQAYAKQFENLGGVLLCGDATSLHRAPGGWRVETSEGPVDSVHAVVALGPWAPDLLTMLRVGLPLAVKRGYHRHWQPLGTVALRRPVLDAEIGYVLAPMDQGLRLTTGAEFANRDAGPTPVQLDRVTPFAKQLLPLGRPIDPQPWLGRRPCLPDSRPVIGRARGYGDLWLCCGHGHYGMTLGPVSGRLLAEMMTGAVPLLDPAPFSAERFS